MALLVGIRAPEGQVEKKEVDMRATSVYLSWYKTNSPGPDSSDRVDGSTSL